MADERCNILDKKDGKVKRVCDKGCRYFSFPHMDRACVLSEVYSVKQGEGCYIYKNKVKRLRDWLPYEAIHGGEFDDDKFNKYLDIEVVEDWGCTLDEDAPHPYWIGTHKNVHNWCIIKNGIAVGWNENPSVGWSFPIKRIKKEK